MRYRTGLRLVAVLAAPLALGGCADGAMLLAPKELRSPMYTAVSPSAASSRKILDAAPVCCESLSALRFEPLDPSGTQFYKIDAQSQAFRFATGKSLVQGLAIPDDLEQATIDLDAVAGATVFVPTVLILDRDFKVTRAIDSSSFRYVPAGFTEPQRLQGRIQLDRRKGRKQAKEKYVLVLTTDRDLQGSTKMIGETRLFARARGIDDPHLPDPIAEHSATGVIRVRVGDLEAGKRSKSAYSRQQKSGSCYLIAAEGAEPAKQKIKPSSTKPQQSEPGKPPTSETASPAMAPETEAVYASMIEESVASGDMDRAWRLVQEAERSGSKNARMTFLKTVVQQ